MRRNDKTESISLEGIDDPTQTMRRKAVAAYNILQKEVVALGKTDFEDAFTAKHLSGV